MHISWLYDLGRAIRDRPAEQKRRWRRYAKPLLKIFREWLTEKKATSAPGHVLHKAISYALRLAGAGDVSGRWSGGAGQQPVETTRLNGLEPWSWLRGVLEMRPLWPASRLDELLPYAEIPQQ